MSGRRHCGRASVRATGDQGSACCALVRGCTCSGIFRLTPWRNWESYRTDRASLNGAALCRNVRETL